MDIDQETIIEGSISESDNEQKKDRKKSKKHKKEKKTSKYINL